MIYAASDEPWDRDLFVGFELKKEALHGFVLIDRQTAEFLCQYFQKGSAVIITGRLEVNSWKTPDGEQRREMLVSVDNVYFGESKPKEAQTPAQV